MTRRRSGILLHLTCLPSPFGIGDMGSCAYRFVDFLHDAKQSCWQILPLNPTDLDYDSSPYHSISAFAFNPNLVSPELLVRDGLLEEEDLTLSAPFPDAYVDFKAVVEYKRNLLHKACGKFDLERHQEEYENFQEENAFWLDDFTLYAALRSRHEGKGWAEWPEGLRDRRPKDLDVARQELSSHVERERTIQYLLHRQWSALKRYCREKGIQIIGDIPIYLDYESADLWTHPDLFKLDEEKKPYVKAGVPPDYFSETGQLWGNPLYDWEAHAAQEYDWWIRRIEHNLKLFDIVRIDHFRGLVAFWEVPASEKTAVKGKWIEAPVYDFFSRLRERLGRLPIIAEDLGHITPDVREAIDRLDLPGMKPILFAFGGDLKTNPYIPHNLDKHCLAYTGTHDNNTARGWFETEATHKEKKNLFQYADREVIAEEVPPLLMRLVMMSVANLAVLPMQDLLGLGADSRMNKPSTKEGNWKWRMLEAALTPATSRRLKEMTETYGRA